ncbi:MAG: VCBS repeat-containing protein [Burkholderiales bacterium]
MKLSHLAVVPLLSIAAAALAQAAPKLADYYTLMPPKLVDANYSALFVDAPPFTADLDGDGNEDLVVLGVDFTCCDAPANVPQPGRVFFGDGQGNFTAAPADRFPIGGFKMVLPLQVLFADFNGDGRPDMFVACRGWEAEPFPGEQNRLYLSDPAGGWRDATATLPQLNDMSTSAAFGDLEGRGVLDIVVGNAVAGQNKIGPYTLRNDGAGRFAMSRSNIPAAPGEVMDSLTGHWFYGTTLADLDGDGRPELILAAGDTVLPYNRLTRTTVLWNHGGAFVDGDRTELPAPLAFPGKHVAADAQAIDVNGDGLPDLVVVGTDATNYDGWFVQILENRGKRTFVDVTSSYLAPADASGSIPGVPYSTAPWPKWVKILDYNGDGLPDFSVEYYPAGPLDASGRQALPPGQPLIYLNDGRGHFSTLKVGDFVAPGNEYALGGGHLFRTRNGYSFIAAYQAGERGLYVAGLLAAKPYRSPPEVRAIEYYNASLDHYFITWLPAEQRSLDEGLTPTRWTRTGSGFNALAMGTAQTSPVCRFYIPPALGDSHFFGRGSAECAATGSRNPTFVLEDAAFMHVVLPVAGACPAGTTPVYRVFDNRPDANHRYLVDRNARDQMVAKGWIAEGDGPDLVVMCAPV